MTPQYFSYYGQDLHFYDLSKASDAAHIASSGNDSGVILRVTQKPNAGDSLLNEKCQVVFSVGGETNILDSQRNEDFTVSPVVYEALALTFFYGLYVHYDPLDSGMTDFPAEGHFITPPGEARPWSYRIRTPLYWREGGEDHDLARAPFEGGLEAIFLVDRSRLSSYLVFNPEGLNTSSIFNEDGSFKESWPGFTRLSAEERAFISYLVVSETNISRSSGKTKLGFLDALRGERAQMPCPPLLFIPTDSLDLSELGLHASAKVIITMDIKDLIYREWIAAGTSYDPDYDEPFMLYLAGSDPWHPSAAEGGTETLESFGGGYSTWHNYKWRKLFYDDGGTKRPVMPDDPILAQGKELYYAKPFLYERDAVSGPMGCSVTVEYED